MAQTKTQDRKTTTPPPAKKATELDLYKPQSVKTVAELLEAQLHKLRAIIPNQIDPARFGRIAIALLSQVPALRECTARSLLGSIAEAAALGLELDRNLGHAYLVPFKAGNVKLAQLIVGYRGFIHLLIETGRVRKVYARPVWEGDKYDMVQGTEERITHVPCPPGERVHHETGEPVLMGCYAVIQFVDGTSALDWMWTSEIDAIRARSKASESGPWVTDYIEMAKKTVIRRLAKTSDASPKVTRIAAAEEARDIGLDVSLTEFTDAELAGARTAEKTRELEQKYTGGDKGPVTGAAGDTPQASPGATAGPMDHPGCEARHAEPGVWCELEPKHRGPHQWRKPPADPPQPERVAGVDDVALPADMGRDPGAEG